MTHHDNLQSADVHQQSSTPPISLASLLSATSYPIPEPSHTTQRAETCLYGGILLSSCRQPQDNNEDHSLDDSPLYEKVTASLDSNTSQHQPIRKSSPASVKRERPRKIDKVQSGEDLEKVRCPPGLRSYHHPDRSNSNAACRIAWLSGPTDTARKQAFQPSEPGYYS